MELAKYQILFALVVLATCEKFPSQHHERESVIWSRIPFGNETDNEIVRYKPSHALSVIPPNRIFQGSSGKLEITDNCEGESWLISAYPRKDDCVETSPSQYDSLPTYTVCFDPTLKQTLYSVGKVYGNGGLPRVGARHFEEARSLFDFKWKDMYKNQRRKLKDSVGATNYARFFPEEQQYAYSCGHLFARGDVNTRVGQAATMFHLNVAPQQGILNAGNWKIIENDVRDFLGPNTGLLKVWTGTFGLLQLPHDDGRLVDMYLGQGVPGTIPVPKYLDCSSEFFWKLVYDIPSTKGVVIIQFNNPHATPAEIAVERIQCTDMCDRVPWLTITQPQRDNILHGYTYCCNVDEFKQIVGYPSELPAIITNY
ncbi:uncharacterized protein LOC118438757 [Folsomia candida]|uniref:uncharacterized protein LOC118438757 n=1 Tax=Folsomia candida TaxID=158441 RepID=UPI0016054BCA|nr:uncharacterized protein LOC118438757 [Folsomia candida]